MKKLLGLCLLLTLCWCCTAALAEEMTIDLTSLTTSAPRSSVTIKNGCITIAKAGTYRISGTLAEGRIVVDAKKDSRVTLILDGAEITCADYAPLYLKKAGTVKVSLAADSENLLVNGGSFAALDEHKVDAVLFARCDVCVSGEGNLTLRSAGGNGLTGKDDVEIKGGSISVTASGHALEANDHLNISGGTLILDAGKDAIHTENDDNAALGIFTLEAGEVSISATDDAVHAVAAVNINGGVLNIAKCAEGLEAAKVYIRGGEVFINSSDDAINATVGTGIDCFEGEAVIQISGGKTKIVTAGDALDSNGDILMEGGELVIHGPGRTKFGFGALDYVNTAVVSGGRFVAFTATGKTFAENSLQPFFNLNLSDWQEAGTAVTILDAEGNVLFTAGAEQAFNSVIVSLPELQVDASGTVMLGDAPVEVRQRNMVTKTKGS